MSDTPTNLASLTIPDGVVTPEAYARCSHLAIGAHQDDLEFMAFHGINTCYGDEGLWFGGVTCTDGAGSAIWPCSSMALPSTRISTCSPAPSTVS